MIGNAPSAPKGFIASVHALRFLAATMVLFSHLMVENRKHGGTIIYDPTQIPWLTGVDIFFIISGFVMYYLSHDKFGQPGYTRSFLRNRFIRVVPLYWLCSTAFLIIAYIKSDLVNNSDLGLSRLIGNYLFLPVPRSDGAFLPIFVLGWTLNFEIFFYLVFSMALTRSHRSGMTFLFTVMGMLAAAGIMTRSQLPFIFFYTQPIILEFLCGIILARLYLDGLSLPGWLRGLLIAGGFAGLSLVGHFGIWDIYMRPLWGGLPCLMIAAGAILGKDLPEKKAWTRFIVAGGTASYSLYLTHMFALRLLTIAWSRLAMPSGWPFIIAGFILAMALAFACYRFVETPLLKLFRSRGTRYKKHSAPNPKSPVGV